MHQASENGLRRGFKSLFSVFLVVWFGLCCSCVPGPQRSAICACVAGYEGNGTHCRGKTDTHVCVATSDRELRRFLCVLHLSEVDPCSSSNGGCSVFAVCSKLSPGERSCTCGKGYTGDGTVCLGRSTNLTVETQIFTLKLLDI